MYYVVPVKSTVEISQHFVAFSEFNLFTFSNFKPEKLKKDDKAILLTVLASKTPITFFHFVQLSYFLGELAKPTVCC